MAGRAPAPRPASSRGGGELEPSGDLALVAAGRGICLLASAVAKHHARAGIVFAPVIDAEPAIVSLARRQGDVNPAADAFIDTVRQVAHSRQSARGDGGFALEMASRVHMTLG
jgi:DNA-binding transcriptional LysR family regulator